MGTKQDKRIDRMKPKEPCPTCGKVLWHWVNSDAGPGWLCRTCDLETAED